MSNFDLIAGYEREKKELELICDVLKHREKYLEKGARIPKGLILYGASGTGKTLFTRVLSKECGLQTFVIDHGATGSIISKIKKAFDEAKACEPNGLVFVDEIDKILPSSSEEYYTDRSKSVLTQLLTLIDGIEDGGRVFFVATCNDYYDLPDSLVRPGRIDKKIWIGLPDETSKKEILDMYIARTDCKFALPTKEIAALCHEFSGAALETLVNECIIYSDKSNYISEELIKQKIRELINEDIDRELSYSEKLVVSCKNLGKFIVAKELRDGDYTLDMESDNFGNVFFRDLINEYSSSGGYDDDYYDDYDDDEDDDYDDYNDDEDDDEDFDKMPTNFYNATDFISAITVVLGGMAAEEELFGGFLDNVANDLARANSLIFKMFDNAMFGIEFVYDNDRNKRLSYTPDKIKALNGKFDETMSSCYENAKRIVKNNIGLIRYLQSILVKKDALKRDDVEKLIEEYRKTI